MVTLNVSPKTLLNIVEDFSKSSVLVLGDIVLDCYIWGSVDRICPEAPVPVVDVKRESSMLGGAGNVVANLRMLGSNVSLCGVVGDDDDGKAIIKQLEERNVRRDGVIVDRTRPTTKKTRIVAGHQQVVRFDHETKVRIAAEVTASVARYLDNHWDRFDAIIVSDYGKGVIHPELLRHIQQARKKRPKIISVDPKERNMPFYKGVSLITPNKKEASAAAGRPIETEEDLREVGGSIIQKLKCDHLVITLGSEGMALFQKHNEYIKIPTFAKEVFDVSGAGDTVVSVLTLALCSGASLPEAALLANTAAGIVVGKIGTASVSAEELKKYVRTAKKKVSEICFSPGAFRHASNMHEL